MFRYNHLTLKGVGVYMNYSSFLKYLFDNLFP